MARTAPKRNSDNITTSTSTNEFGDKLKNAIKGEFSSVSMTDQGHDHTVTKPRYDVGATAFDAIEAMSSVGQITSYRAVANGAICGAVFAINDSLMLQDEDDEKSDEARFRSAQQIELYLVAKDKLENLAITKFDMAMSLDDAIDFASKNAAGQRELTDLPDEVLKAIGIGRGELTLIDATEKQRQLQRDAKLRASLQTNERQIRAELLSLIDNGFTDGVMDQLNAQQHLGLYNKLAKKLSGRVRQVLGIRDRYDGALGDAMLLSADIRELDKQYVAFTRRNKEELRETADA